MRAGKLLTGVLAIGALAGAYGIATVGASVVMLGATTPAEAKGHSGGGHGGHGGGHAGHGGHGAHGGTHVNVHVGGRGGVHVGVRGRGVRVGVGVGGRRFGGRYYGGTWYGTGRRWYGGRWWAYGVGRCWKWSPIGYVWVCG
jgi:hypothetical protein